MKTLATNVFRPVRVLKNTTKKQADYFIIKCAESGKVLHCGRPAYIRRVAKERYNAKIS